MSTAEVAQLDVRDEGGNTALHLAVKSEDHIAVKQLLEAGAKVNTADIDGCSVLLTSVGKNNFNITKLLINRGAQTEASNKEGCTALHLAVKENNAELVELLVEAGANVNSFDKQGKTILHLAVIKSNCNIIQTLINEEVQLEACDKESRTALHFAVEYKNQDVVKMLLEAGASVNNSIILGNKILHTSVIGKIFNITETLLNYLTKSQACDQKGSTTTHSFVKFNDQKHVKPLQDIGSSKTSDGITQNSELSLIKLLLNKGAKIKACSVNSAVRNNDQALLEMLLEAGADVNTFGHNDRFPLCTATSKQSYNRPRVELILKKSNPFVVPNENSPLHKAISYKHYDMVKLLLNKGAQLEVRNELGYTALHLAVKMGDQKIVELLLEAGADIDTFTNQGSILNTAVENKNYNMVQLILNKGVPLEVRNKLGYTALHSAVDVGDQKIVELLLEAGAGVNTSNSFGTSTLDSAIDRREKKLIS